MDEYKTLVIILSFLLVGAVAIIVISSDFDNNEVLNPHRSDYQIPEWVKNNAYWWSQDHITDSEFSYAVDYLIEEGVITIEKCIGECSNNG